MSSIFITSDQHFSHEKILVTEERPFNNIKTMNEFLIENWNRTVKQNDLVFVAGDFSFDTKENTKAICKELNGDKVLIMGNHDLSHGFRWWMDVGFCEVYKRPILYENQLIIQHRPPKFTDSAYFYAYGHVHANSNYKTIDKNTVCVCSARWGYTPVEISTLLKLMRSDMTNK